MADSASMQIDGLQQMLAELRSLPDVLQKRVMKGAVATGCSVIRKEAILNAPEWTGPVSQGHPPPGTLKRAIYQTRLTDECTATVETWKVDVRRGKAAQSVKRGKSTVNLDAYYATWVEYGHYTRAPKGQSRRVEDRAVRAAARGLGVAHWVPAKPFMRPAFDLKAKAAIDAMQSYFNERLPAALLAMKYIKAQGL